MLYGCFGSEYDKQSCRHESCVPDDKSGTIDGCFTYKP